MRLFSSLLVFFFCSFLVGATSTLDQLWAQIKEKVEERKNEHITDSEFIEWYMSNVRRILSRREMRIAMMGLPDVIIDASGNELSQQAINGKWRDLLSIQWGDLGNEVHVFWSNTNVKDLCSASKKKCFLFSEIAHFQPLSEDFESELKIFDSPIGVKPLFWAFIYGKEVLPYPRNANLQPLFYGPVRHD